MLVLVTGGSVEVPLTGSATDTVYCTGAHPWPLLVQLKLRSPTPAPLVTDSKEGVSGACFGVTGDTGSEVVLPPPLVAVTVRLYCAQLLSPETVVEVVEPETFTVNVDPAGTICAARTVYPEIVLPLGAAAVQVTGIW